MIPFAKLKQRFATLSRPVRLAFLGSAAERILPIYEKFWVGDHHPEIAKTIELAWQTIEGTTIDPVTSARCLTVAKEVADVYAEDSLASLAEVAAIAGYIMDLVEETDEADAALAAPRGYASVMTAADAVDGVLAQNGVPNPMARAEEEAWLDAAVARAEMWNRPLTRDMFRDLGAVPPNWWGVYSAVNRPY